MSKCLSFATASLLIVSFTGCGSDSSNGSTTNDSTTNTSYTSVIPTSGSTLPYSVLDNTIDDGAKPDSKMEIRNGGYGSAAAAHPTNNNQFYALTDRGPNATYSDGKMFPTPDYTPRIGLFEIQKDGSVKKIKEILFKRPDGTLITGLPNPAGLGATNEKPYDKNGNLIVDENNDTKLDAYGLDSEALAAMNDGTFWVSDEYGPHIVHFDKDGKEIDRINPFVDDNRTSMNLPAEFAHRRANRGMEGLAITPDQKTLVGIMQSTMDNPKAAHTSTITRIVTINLETKAIKQYLYKQDKPANSNSEIVAISSDEFLVIERDGAFSGATPSAQKYIYRIKLSTGTELEALSSSDDADFTQDADLGLTIGGETLEEVVYGDGTNLAKGWENLAKKGIYPVSKELVVDMVADFAYPHDKMEGLILFKDGNLGVLNDDDFATWVTGGVLEQKYLDDTQEKIDQNTLYVIKNPVLGDKLVKLGSFNTNEAQGSEIVAYDKASKKMFVTNGANNKIDIIDISTPTAPTKLSSIDLSAYGTGVNSVAAHNGVVAAAVEVKSTDGLYTNSKGKVVFFNVDGSHIRTVEVGYLPDMLTFNEDNTKVVVANEGEPNGDYSVDPIGSVGIITVADGSYVDVKFSSATLSDATDGTPVRLGGTPSDDQAKDIEPEYIAISGEYAYVTLQENNAIAKVNINNGTLEYVKSFGAKSYESDSGNTIDIEEDGEIRMQSYPGLFGLYMPDTIASYTTNNTTYLVTANEGDGREYPINDFNATLETGDVLTDDKKISKLKLDPSIADAYTDDNDLKVVIDMGDTDNDGDYDKLYTYGARSFSIWNTEGNLVFDSGNSISKIVANAQPALFNQDKGEMDGRSGNKGAEPEALAVGEIDGKTYVFVGLERQNGIVMYDITNPAKVKFVDYIETESEGEISPEGMKFIPESDSPNGKNLLLVANEISGSTAIYEIK
ncbi:MAG TPA: hypothetical protein ENO02_08300 [Epsilonproteobacteria bacterium]|nr:hypothetical protein [Campylobacterota bacterium]